MSFDTDRLAKAIAEAAEAYERQYGHPPRKAKVTLSKTDEERSMTPEQRDVVDGYLISSGIELSKEERAALDAELEARLYEPGSPQAIAKRFEQDPAAYAGLLHQDPRHLAWYQSEVQRLAKIDEITQPADHTGKQLAANAAARLAKKLQAEDPSLSEVDALSKAYAQQPDLYMQ